MLIYIILFILLLLLAYIALTYKKINLVSGGNDDFPYKIMSKNEINTRFTNLKTYTPDIQHYKYTINNIPDINTELLKYNNEYTVIVDHNYYYDKYDQISDYFNEPVRMKCRRNDQTESSLDYWYSHQNTVTSYCKKYFGQVNKHNLRESLYKLHLECNQFKPHLIVAFIKLLNITPNDLILDISAGWGDRAIGAMSQNIPYYGVDPNTELHKGYAKMVKFFKMKKQNYTFIDAKFQTASLPKSAKLIFSSPPYFDLEIYVINSKTQSIHNNNIYTWYQNFLLFSLKRAFKILENLGYMVIYINDMPNNKFSYVKQMLEDVGKFPNCKYLGCISQHDAEKRKSPQPFWIWQKIIK